MLEVTKCARCGGRAEPDDLYCQHCGAGLEPNGGTAGAAARDVDSWPSAGGRDVRREPAERAGLRQPAAGGIISERAVEADAVSDATRFLCVGAHLDEDFSKSVVKELFGQTLRAVAPSYGFDLRPVALHCLAARRGRRIRDLVLTVLGLLMFISGALPAVSIGLFWWAAGWLIGALRDGPQGLRRAIDRLSLRSIAFVLIISWLAFFVATVWTTLATLVRLASNQSSLGTAPGSQAAVPSAQTAIVSPFDFLAGIVTSGFLIVLFWAGLYIVVLAGLLIRRSTIVRSLRAQPFRKRPEPAVSSSKRIQDRLDEVARAQSDNTTVYSDYDPFVGTGVPLPGWSFAMSIKADTLAGRQLKPFSVVELVDRIRLMLGDIGAPVDSTESWGHDGREKLPGLVVFDHVFVNTGAIRGDRRFLPNPSAPPRTALSPEEFREIAGAPRGPVRHYLGAYVQSWSGEVVPFMFFHFSTDGEKLYFECVKRVLLPTRQRFHVVDITTPHLSGGEFFRLAAEAAGRTVATAVRAPGRLVSDLLFDLRADSPPSDTLVDYGARISVREKGSHPMFLNYFQDLDVDKHLKIVERQVMATIAEFLADHGVDTAEFVERQVWILNQNTNNINMTGNNNTVGSAAAGSGASAVNNSGPATRPPSGQTR